MKTAPPALRSIFRCSSPIPGSVVIQNNTHGDAAFTDYAIVFGYSRSF
jgi:hypothetical protein